MHHYLVFIDMNSCIVDDIRELMNDGIQLDDVKMKLNTMFSCQYLNTSNLTEAEKKFYKKVHRYLLCLCYYSGIEYANHKGPIYDRNRLLKNMLMSLNSKIALIVVVWICIARSIVVNLLNQKHLRYLTKIQRMYIRIVYYSLNFLLVKLILSSEDGLGIPFEDFGICRRDKEDVDYMRLNTKNRQAIDMKLVKTATSFTLGNMKNDRSYESLDNNVIDIVNQTIQENLQPTEEQMQTHMRMLFGR